MLKLVKYFYRRFYWKEDSLNCDNYPPQELLLNVNGGDSSKRALLLFVSDPFQIGYDKNAANRHSNHQHSLIFVRILDTFGYSVDVTDWMNPSPPDLDDYDLVVGHGLAFERACRACKKDNVKIFLAYGADNDQAITAEQRRISSFGKRTGIIGRRRYRRRTDNGPVYASHMLIHGNQWVLSTYRRKTTCPAYYIANSNIQGAPLYEDLPTFRRNRNHYLWFASFGAIHRGLDLLIEVFSERPHLTLHVVGSINHERELFLAYSDVFRRCSNIVLHGFMDITKNDFREIVTTACCHLFLSASDASPGAVVTTMNAGLIPVVTRESGIDIPKEGVLLSACCAKEIIKAINEVSSLSDEELCLRCASVACYAQNYFTTERFEDSVTQAFQEILQ